jgi:predicted GTPase
MDELTDEEIQEVRRVLLASLEANPPTIGVIGVSGTGKSSTINAMFKTGLKISHTRACTKQFQATPMRLTMKEGVAKNDQATLVVVDAPGLGEDIRMDSTYIDQYHERLPDCDVILWVLAARNRAVHLDQMYLKEFVEYRDRMIFAVNQVDIVHPMNWNERINLPSVDMEHNIEDIVKDRAEKLGGILGETPKIIAFSAAKGFNLEQLFSMLISAIPQNRRFIFDALKNFSYRDFTPVLADANPPKKWRISRRSSR